MNIIPHIKKIKLNNFAFLIRNCQVNPNNFENKPVFLFSSFFHTLISVLPVYKCKCDIKFHLYESNKIKRLFNFRIESSAPEHSIFKLIISFFLFPVKFFYHSSREINCLTPSIIIINQQTILQFSN